MYSPIALCCISLNEKEAVVTEPEIHSLFKDFTSISKILIFHCSPILKCFIEFSNSESLEKALKNVDRISPKFGKLSLYHSKKDCLLNAFEFPPESNSAKTERTLFCEQNNLSGSQSGIHENLKVRIANDDQGAGDLHEVKNEPNMNLSVAKSQSVDKCSKTASTNADSTTKWMKLDEIDSSEIEFVERESTGLLGQKSDGKKVILAESYEMDPRSLKYLVNAIGCFGNLLKVVANFKKQRIFAEMQNAHQANLVRLYLDDFEFFGCHLRVRHAPVDFLKKPDGPESETIKYLELENWTFRFKRHLSIKFNPPSKILHFTSLSPRVDHLILYLLVSQIHEPLKIYKLNKSMNLSAMFLAEFKTVNQSLEVLSVLHNKILDKKSMKISFSHPKLTYF